jgi:mannose-1-phosphate guanylyltransferase
MKALLLAAGFGTRLSPITDIIPKCLVPINGKPLLEYWIQSLLEAGIDSLLINTHYKSEWVTEWVTHSAYAPYITLVHEPTILGTAGTLLANSTWIGQESVMLIHADNLCTASLPAFIKTHQNRPSQTQMTMMTFSTDTPESCGIVDLDASGVVQGFYEKVENPPSDLANGALYIIEPSLMQKMAESRPIPTDFSTQVIPHLMGKIMSHHNDHYHRDIGSFDALLSAQLDFKSHLKTKQSDPIWNRMVVRENITSKFAEAVAQITQCSCLTFSNPDTIEERLNSPAVIVIDASLNAAQLSIWLTAIEKNKDALKSSILIFAQVPETFSSANIFQQFGAKAFAISQNIQ